LSTGVYMCILSPMRQEKSAKTKRTLVAKRSRNAEATKADILRAARATFAASGYDSVGCGGRCQCGFGDSLFWLEGRTV
jgi:hypothetical protein